MLYIYAKVFMRRPNPTANGHLVHVLSFKWLIYNFLDPVYIYIYIYFFFKFIFYLFFFILFFIFIDEDPGLRIESFAIIKLRGVTTKYKNIFFTMQTFKEQ